jgi:hypothetical protein
MDVYNTLTPASSQMAAYCAARIAGSSTYVTFCKWSRNGMEKAAVAQQRSWASPTKKKNLISGIDFFLPLKRQQWRSRGAARHLKILLPVDI